MNNDENLTTNENSTPNEDLPSNEEITVTSEITPEENGLDSLVETFNGSAPTDEEPNIELPKEPFNPPSDNEQATIRIEKIVETVQNIQSGQPQPGETPKSVPEEETEKGFEEQIEPVIEIKDYRESEEDPNEEPIEPNDLLALVTKKLKESKLKCLIIGLICLPMLYLTIAPQLILSLPKFLLYNENPVLFIFILIVLLCAVMIVAADKMVSGIMSLIHKRADMDFLIVMTSFVTIFHCVSVFVTKNSAYIPLCVFPALALLISYYGDIRKYSAQVRGVKNAINLKKPGTVSIFRNVIDDKIICMRNRSNSNNDFYKSFLRPNYTDKIINRYVPAIFLISIALSFVSTASTGRTYDFFWALSTIMIMASAWTFFIFLNLPYSKISKKLLKKGSVIGGSTVAFEYGKCNSVALFDEDIFPFETISIDAFKHYGNTPYNTVIAYTTAVLKASECGVAMNFEKFCETNNVNSNNISVTSHCFLDDVGITAYINSHKVIIGNTECMKKIGVSYPPSIQLSTAIFCVIDNELCGIFAVKYNYSLETEDMFGLLFAGKHLPLLATRDFNVNLSTISNKFGINSGVTYPSNATRAALNCRERNSSANGVVLLLDDAVSMAEFLEGCRRIRQTVKLNIFLGLASSVLGIGLSSLMIALGTRWYSTATPLNIIIYSAVWMFFTWLASLWVNKF